MSDNLHNQPVLNEYKQQVADYFNSRTNYDDSNLAQKRARHFVEAVPIQKGQTILDVAVGTGLVAISVAELVGNDGKVIGIDIANNLLNIARGKIEELGIKNIELIEADADDIDFSENSFDAILCCSAIMCFRDIHNVLRNWYRFVKPGGLVAFNSYHEQSLMAPTIFAACAKYGISLPNIHAPLGTVQKCENMLKEAGFQNIDVKTEQFGKCLTLNDARNTWNGKTWLYPDNPLLKLPTSTIEQIKAEYDTQIEALATEKGVWWDITTFLAIGHKA
ncbi:putative methyltransferase [Calothrix sp. NIES-4071]|nr:putative methyltransferase [Calothrix sp. NIES-4071]BAZ60092.1 putative methyltransferase [Calothrix sp. NIES-4105]